MKLTLILLAAAAALVGAVALASPAAAEGTHPQTLPDPASCGAEAEMSSVAELRHCARDVSFRARTDIGLRWRAWAKKWQGACRAIPEFQPDPEGPRHSARWAAKLPAKLNQMRGRTTGDSLADIGRLCIVRNTTPNPVDNSAQQPGPQTEEQERREFFTPPPAVPPAAQTEVDAVNARIAKEDVESWESHLGYGAVLDSDAQKLLAELKAQCLAVTAEGWAPVWTDPEMGTAVINNSEYPDRVIVPASCRLEAAAG